MTSNNGNEGRLLEEAQKIIGRAYQRIKIDRQYRRLHNALGKLGVTQIVGVSWCFINEDNLQICFGALPEHRRNLFIEHLVDLADKVGSGVRERVPGGAQRSAGPEQLRFDLGPDFSGEAGPERGSRS